jgi:hypothetical protein
MGNLQFFPKCITPGTTSERGSCQNTVEGDQKSSGDIRDGVESVPTSVGLADRLRCGEPRSGSAGSRVGVFFRNLFQLRLGRAMQNGRWQRMGRLLLNWGLKILDKLVHRWSGHRQTQSTAQIPFRR